VRCNFGILDLVLLFGSLVNWGEDIISSFVEEAKEILLLGMTMTDFTF